MLFFYLESMKTNAWLYVCGILFTSYFWMQSSNDTGIGFYLAWIFFHLSFLAPVLGFVLFNDQVGSVRRKVIFWISSFLLGPVGIYYGLKITGVVKLIDPILNYKLIPAYEFLLMESVLTSVITFLLLSFRIKPDKVREVSWLKKVTVLRVAIFAIFLLALSLPLISTDFQIRARSVSVVSLIAYYLISVPQIFLVYFSYYFFHYINHRFLYSRVYVENGLIAYLLGLLGLLFSVTPLTNLWISLFPVVYQLRIHPIGAGANLMDDINFLFPILVLLVSFPVIILVEWNRRNNSLKNMEREKTQAELTLLKQQINPHFFFNTLNNLYALCLEKADKAPDLVLKLSELMRYVIYKGRAEKVKLVDEIKYIRDYIDLQRLRSTQDIDVKFEIFGLRDDILVPPLLLIILVENAFKHGIEPSAKGGFVHIYLKIDDSRLFAICINSLDDQEVVREHGGIGLINLRRRLSILYGKNYFLQLSRKKTEFEANLEIPL